MKRAASIVAVLGGVAVSLAGPVSAQAAPPADMHCPDHDSSEVTKVELDGSTTHLDLAPGTTICVKAGTGNTGLVVVGEDGYEQDVLVNKKGVPLGISYYVVYPCVPNESGFCEVS